jgi:pimeloyl-ACP methyl ester carboxylesterase
MAFARRTWVEKEGALTLTYDPKLSGALEGIDAERTIPALWPQFDALAHRPMLVLRGALTDLLSLQTVAEMRARRAKLEVLTVPDQGHAPMLDSPELIDAIAEFARGCDKTVGRL